jgi:hypothetical protein
MSLDLKEYNTKELFNLFKLSSSVQLTQEHLKQAKKITMKVHPDKSGLDPRYFRFFLSAYNVIQSIYEQQTGGHVTEIEDALTDEHMNLLSNMFKKHPELKNPKEFNNWFNEQFPAEDDDYYEDDEVEDREEFIPPIAHNTAPVTRDTLNSAFEAYKDSTMGQNIGEPGAMNVGSGSNFGSILDTPMVISVPSQTSMVDNRNRTIQDIQRDRGELIVPMSKERAHAVLNEAEALESARSAELAFSQIQQTNRSIEQQQGFWKKLKLLM